MSSDTPTEPVHAGKKKRFTIRRTKPSGDSSVPGVQPQTTSEVIMGATRRPLLSFLHALPVVMVLSAVFSLVALLDGYSVSSPIDSGGSLMLATWLMISVIIPVTVIYLINAIIPIYVLSGKDIKYVAWVIKEGYNGIVFGYLMSLTISIIAVSFAIVGAADMNFIPNFQTGISIAARNMGVFSALAMMMTAWVGYKTAWKVYRTVGAMTEKMRHEEFLRDLEIDNSGRWWDRKVEKRIKSLSGRDGRKPYWGFLWFFIIGQVTTALSMTLREFTESVYVGMFATIFILSLEILIIATLQKRRDVLMKKKWMPVLIPVRTPTHDVPYSPKSSGVRHFRQD